MKIRILNESSFVKVEPYEVKMKNGEIYTVIAVDTIEFGRYLARTPWGEEVIIRDEDIEEFYEDEEPHEEEL